MRVRLQLATVAAAVAAIAFAYGIADPGFGGDSIKYITVGQNIAANGCVSLSPPDAAACQAHWGGNQFPGYPFVIAVATRLSAPVTDMVNAVTMTIALQASLLAVAAWWLSVGAWRLTGSRAAAFAVLLAAELSPLHVAWTRWILTETVATAVVIWVFAELVYSVHNRRLRVVPLGVALAAAFFIRFDTLPLVAAVALVAFAVHRPRDALIRGLAVAMIMAAPIAVWSGRNVVHDLSVIPQADYGVGYRLGGGYYAWLSTWTTGFYEASFAAYPFAERKYDQIDVPANVFEEPGGERARKLLAILRERPGTEIPPAIDQAFGRLATLRRTELPLQVLLVNPSRRAFSMWIAPAYSFGWPLELGTNVQAAVLENGLASIPDILRKNPIVVTGKAALVVLRLLLVVAFIAVTVHAIAQRSRTVPILLAVVAYILGKTLFVALLGQADPRLTVQPYAVLAAVVVLEVIAWSRKPSPRMDYSKG